MSWLHHSRHHHSCRILHSLSHLTHSWISHSHHLLLYVLHDHLRSGRHTHKIRLSSLSTAWSHHHLWVLRSTPYSRMAHPCSNLSCHLLLLHHFNLHGITTIRTLSHITWMGSTHLHRGRGHHRGSLMTHWGLLLSYSLLSKLCVAMCKGATIFVRAILS